MINQSELILNADGSIYHLALHREQVATIIFLVGDPGRVPLVSRHFDQIDHRIQKREFVTHTGRVGNRGVTVLSTGIGPDNIDIVLNELDALFNIDPVSRAPRPDPVSLTFIRLGTAGGLQPDIPVDSLVISSGGLGLDGLLQFYKAPQQQQHPLISTLRQHMLGRWHFPLAPYYSQGDPGLVQVFSAFGAVGITATNPGFYGPQGRTLRIPAAMPDYLDVLAQFEFENSRIVNLEMETAAIYGLSELLGHKACSISAILANRPLGAFSKHPGKAVERLVETALGALDRIKG
jgi:uridine phosphorylase